MENYDMEALYLYSDDWRYKVGKIEKVNDKSIRMEFGTKIKKEDFNNVHKLSEEEVSIYKGELIKKLSRTSGEIKSMLYSIESLNSALRSSTLACVNSNELQKRLDLLNTILSEELPKIIKIDNKEFTIDEGYSDNLIEKGK